MASNHIHRVLLIVPEARVAAVGAWWQANMDAADNLSTWPRLNATGSVGSASTHRWCCTALTDLQCRTILFRLCDLAAVARPSIGTWNAMTSAQKRTWLASVRAGVLAGYGIYVRLADNIGGWDDPEALLATAGLKRRQEAIS
jgi:hypothetical protein